MQVSSSSFGIKSHWENKTALPCCSRTPVGRDWLSSALFVPPLSSESMHRIKGQDLVTALGQRLSGKDVANLKRVDSLCTGSLGRFWILRVSRQSLAKKDAV